MDPEMETLKMRIRTLKPLEYNQQKLNRQQLTTAEITSTNRRSKKSQHFYSLLPPSTAVLNDAMPELSDIVPQKSGKTKNKFKSALSRLFNVGGGGGGGGRRNNNNKRKKLTVDDIVVNTDSIILVKNPKDQKQQQQQQQQQYLPDTTATNTNNGPHSQLLNIIHSDDNFKIAMAANANNNNDVEENIYQNTIQRKIAALNFINATAPSSSSLVVTEEEMYDFPPLPPLPNVNDITSSSSSSNGDDDDATNNVDYDEVANLIYDTPLDDSGHISNGITTNATDAIFVNNTIGYDYGDDGGDGIYEEILTPNRGSFNYSDSTFDSVTDDDDNTDDVVPIESVTTITADDDVIATVTVE